VDTRVVEVELPNGATALVRAVEVEGIGATKTGLRDKFKFDEVAQTLEGITEAMKATLAKVTPDKVSVELGIELALKAGQLTALIVEGGGRGALTVTLEWERDRQQS
jgi:Trypsin-co-occurring domain 1